MKKSTILSLWVMLVLSLLLLLSCNPSQHRIPSIDDGIEWTTLTGVLTDSSDDNLPDYVVTATSTETGRTFSGVVDDAGRFTVRVPRGGTFILSLISSDGEAVGSITVASEERRISIDRSDDAETAFMGIIAGSDGNPLDLGTIKMPEDVETDPIVATIPEESINTIITAMVDTSGVPVGIGSLGKTDTSDSSDSDTAPNIADPDGDGLPNVIDADDDGDGIIDDMDPDADGDGTVDSETSLADILPVEFTVGYLLDIRGGEGIHSYFGGDDDKFDGLVRDMRADLMVNITDPARMAAVESVAILIDSSPEYTDTLVASEFDTTDPTQTFVDGSTAHPGYDPVTGNPIPSMDWSDMENSDGIPYQIPISMMDSSDDRVSCRVGLKLPEGSTSLFEAGDTFTVELRYSEESGIETEYYSQMINFIYDNVTRFQAWASGNNIEPSSYTSVYDGTEGSPYPGDASKPIELTYDGGDDYIWFKIIPPKDDDGNYITTGGFRYELFDHINDGADSADAATDPSAGLSSPDLTVFAGTWQTDADGDHNRYDSDLSDERLSDDGDPFYFAVPLPVKYILEADDNGDGSVEIEYFMNINDESYIKNRLVFSIAEGD